MPASSNPWSTDYNTGDYNKQLVHYVNDETNGAYYTWCAATAGSCSSATSDGAVASSSICPKGWRLPTRAEYENFMKTANISYLIFGTSMSGSSSAADSEKIRSAPYNFPAAGYVNNGALNGVGSSGYCWTSSATNDNDRIYNLGVGNANVGILNNPRFNGYSVRCIAL